MNQEKQKSILIVNAEPETADLFAEMLLTNINCYIVTTTFTGKGCLSGIMKNKPDMVLMDIELPDMDGWDLIEELKKYDSDLPVVVITSRIPDISDMSRLSMVSDYLIKPVTLDCLNMAVSDALEIPTLLEKCLQTIKDNGDRCDIKYSFYLLLRQSIADRKRFILMRQLYPDKELEHDPGSRTLLNNLKEKIDMAQSEINHFKNIRFLLA